MESHMSARLSEVIAAALEVSLSSFKPTIGSFLLIGSRLRQATEQKGSLVTGCWAADDEKSKWNEVSGRKLLSKKRFKKRSKGRRGRKRERLLQRREGSDGQRLEKRKSRRTAGKESGKKGERIHEHQSEGCLHTPFEGKRRCERAKSNTK